MTPLQSIGMGLVLVLLDVNAGRWDIIPDIVGWVLVIRGVVGLRSRLDTSWILGSAIVAGVVSLALVDSSVVAGLPPSTGWLLSLPEVVFSFLLANGLAGLLTEDRPDLASRFRVLRWVFVAVGAGPVLLFGGGIDELLVPLAVLAVGSSVYLIVLSFRASGPVEATAEPA